MRTVAIAANLLQMIIIVGLFLVHGIALGGLTIVAFFVLLIIAFINLLVLLFHAALSAEDRTSQRTDKGGLIKRQDYRVRYLRARRPELIIDDRRFSVLDLSENGMRIGIGRDEKLKRRFQGQITLLSGQTLDLQLFRARRMGNEAALLIKKPIDWDVITTEKELAAAPAVKRRG